MKNKNGERLVRHHEKYLELHGEDKVVIMTVKEHIKLHQRLRREGKCAIPSHELKLISLAAAKRASTGKMFLHKLKRDHNKINVNSGVQPNEINIKSQNILDIVFITNSKLREGGRVIINKDTRKAGNMEIGDILQLEITVIKKRENDSKK